MTFAATLDRMRDALDEAHDAASEREALMRVAEAIDALRAVVAAQYDGASPAMTLALDLVDDSLRQAFAAVARNIGAAR